MPLKTFLGGCDFKLSLRVTVPATDLQTCFLNSRRTFLNKSYPRNHPKTLKYIAHCCRGDAAASSVGDLGRHRVATARTATALRFRRKICSIPTNSMAA